MGQTTSPQRFYELLKEMRCAVGADSSGQVGRVKLPGRDQEVAIGDRIHVERPTDSGEGPGWTDDMDKLAGEEMTVTIIKTVPGQDMTIVRVKENDKVWDVRWVRK